MELGFWTFLGTWESKANMSCAFRRRDKGRSRFPHGDGGEAEDELVENGKECPEGRRFELCGPVAWGRLSFYGCRRACFVATWKEPATP